MNDGNIEFTSEDCMPIMEACIKAGIELFNDPMTVKEMLMLAESLKMSAKVIEIRLGKSGVKIGKRLIEVK